MRTILLPFLVSALVVTITFVLFEDLEGYFTALLESVSKYPIEFAVVSFLVLASDILLPIPSSIVMYLNGFVLGLTAGALVSLGGLLVGAMIGYAIGRFSSKAWNAESIRNQQAQTLMQHYGSLAVLMSRGIPILSESVCFVCGFHKMPFGNYLLMNFVGLIPVCLLYAACGLAGYNENTFLLSFGASLLVSLSFWYFGKSYFMKKKVQSDG